MARDEESSKRMERLRLVLLKVLDSASAELQTDDVITSFSELVRDKPDASKAIEEYHPQLLEQIRENVQTEFDDMCQKRRINHKLRELENLLATEGTMASTMATNDPLNPALDSTLPTGVDPEIAMRQQSIHLKREECASILSELAQVEAQNEAHRSSVGEHESGIRAALGRLDAMISEVSVATQSTAGAMETE